MEENYKKKERGERIGKIIAGSNQNSRKFALSIPIDPSQLRKIEKGDINLSYEMAKAIVDKYSNVKIEWLLEGKGDEPIWNNVPQETSNNQEIRQIEEHKLESSVSDALSMQAIVNLTESGKTQSDALKEAVNNNSRLIALLEKKESPIIGNVESEIQSDVIAKMNTLQEFVFEEMAPLVNKKAAYLQKAFHSKLSGVVKKGLQTGIHHDSGK